MHDRDESFKKIVDRNGGRLARISAAYVGGGPESQDLLQEILLNIWKSLSSFKGDAHIDTWVYRVAVNTSLMHRRSLRRRSWEQSADMEDTPGGITSPEGPGGEKAWKRLLFCISQLKARDRLAVSLVLEGLSHKEIAGIVGVTVNHIGVIVHRLKRELGACIQGESHGI